MERDPWGESLLPIDLVWTERSEYRGIGFVSGRMDANCIGLKSLELGKAEVRGQTRIQKVCIRNITEAIRSPT